MPEFEPLTVRYKKKIYGLTRGIPHCLFFLIEQANVLGLRSGEAKFSLDLLDIVFEKRFSIMKTGIIALRDGNVGAFDDLMSAGQYIDKEVEKLVKKLIKIGDNINLSKAEAKSLYEHVEKYLPEYKPTKAEEKILEKLFKKAELEATDLIEEDGYLRVPM
mgnify:FL=1